VGGRGESWRKCQNSPATFSPHLSFLGIIMVGKVDQSANDIMGSLSNHAWMVEGFRGGGKYPASDEYVRQVLFYLCQKNTISLPSNVKNNFFGHIGARLSKLQEKPILKINQYLIIPIVGGDVVVGQTKV
jgi:hypothetical protein